MRISNFLSAGILAAMVGLANAAPAADHGTTNLDALLASQPGPDYALTNNFGTTDPVWVLFSGENITRAGADQQLSERALCNAPHVEMYSGGKCDGGVIRTLTLNNKQQCYYALNAPFQFTTMNIDGYNGATGTNYWQLFRGGSSNYCSALLYSLVNWVGCVSFNDGFFYANGVTWDCF
ncbi:hypothetical protein DXG01_016172 [Tephrocybe rancida]|nr:hypothetical protein DXG01_016172 [Tephrocybe rancida]